MKPTRELAVWIWVATARLHRENPGRKSFSIAEIVARVERELRAGSLRREIRAHARVHCVASQPPSPARHCVLHAEGAARRRLWRPGDPIHPGRIGAAGAPSAAEAPEGHSDLLAWYSNELAPDPLLALRGSGAGLWEDERADAYVERLRAGETLSPSPPAAST